MNSFFFEIIIILLLIIINGIFAMSEIAIISSRKSRLEHLARSGDPKAQIALNIASNPNQFLSTVQVGITLIGIMSGAFGGATIAEKLALYFKEIPFLEAYSKSIAFGIVVIIITYLSLIIGELVPKRLGLNKPELIASTIAKPMQILSKIAMPIVHLLDFSADCIIRMLGIKKSDKSGVTPEEIKMLVEAGKGQGIFEESEQEMIESVLHLDEKQILSIMTPRMHIVFFDIEDTSEKILKKISSSRHSRFPVVSGDLDNVIGIIHTKDLLVQNLSNLPVDFKTMIKQPLFIPESISALKVLELFKKHRTHMALINDEYGTIQGMVTHNDILEAIIGDMPSNEEPKAFQREDGSWLIDGLLSIDKFKELLNINNIHDEERAYHTISGFIMNQLSGIPSVGQHFEWENLRFEVVDMDGRRVDKVLVSIKNSNKRTE
ncbi:MAG: HlyC/CorC family transporter [Desulfobacterales bacterium]|nr:HlyC/CorC family transporter [Desulfobacterales bacterium]